MTNTTLAESSMPQLKKPVAIYFLAVLFLLAPIGNIFISFAGSGVANWYDPSVFIPFMQTIPGLDWAWLGLLFVTGLLLFKAHKLSWTIAILTLLLVLSINIYRVYFVDTNSIAPHFLKIFSVIAVLCTLGVLVIAFYFRFPYLDRRTEWTSSKQKTDRRSNERGESPGRRKS